MSKIIIKKELIYLHLLSELHSYIKENFKEEENKISSCDLLIDTYFLNKKINCKTCLQYILFSKTKFVHVGQLKIRSLTYTS